MDSMDSAVEVVKAVLSRSGRQDPYPYYARLHAMGPVCRLSAPEIRFDVLVHGYDAANQVLRDSTFHVMDSEYPDRRASARWRDHPALRTLLTSVFFTEGPYHVRTRKLFSQAFTARRVLALEPAIVRLTEQRLDELAKLGANGDPVDFVAEFALPLPSDVIGELLGVPDKDRPWFPPRVRAIGDILDLGSGTWKHQQAADRAAVELTGYFAELVAKRRVEPRDDLVSLLVQGLASEADLTEDELLANLITLYNGGFVTTTHLLGSALTLLLDHPEATAALLDRPELITPYLEEILRLEPPTHFTIRWAAEDTEIAGVPVAAGDRVLILLAAANRDPNRFADPDVFDPARPDNQPLSFGVGIHYCLGAALSRLEGQVALPLVLQRFPRLALAGPPGERTKLMLRGYENLPVALG
jgi:cytochrome P450